VHLAASKRGDQTGGLPMAAISVVYTISHVATLLGEDEDWLQELSIMMFPEDGRLFIVGIGEVEITAFTEDGIEYLREVVRESRR
jgi:hypothetical protein